MATVQDLLRVKGSDVWSVSPDTSVLEALELMAEKNIGALLVLDQEGKIAGIVSERDFARHIAKAGQCIVDEPVKNFMTEEVIGVHPETSIDECMMLMTKQRIRHLPVATKEGKLVGMISIGDVVKQVIADQSILIASLENYILGRDYPR
ncbi:MAG: CBS domain-containing protein [Anaerolineales bacterium]